MHLRGWMKTEVVVSLSLLFVAAMPSFGQPSEDFKRRFDEAERRIMRLQPTVFPELPGNVVRELNRRSCHDFTDSVHERNAQRHQGRICETRPNRLGCSVL